MPNHKCHVEWCIALEKRTDSNACAVHERNPTASAPPPVQKELQRRYEEETAQAYASR